MKKNFVKFSAIAMMAFTTTLSLNSCGGEEKHEETTEAHEGEEHKCEEGKCEGGQCEHGDATEEATETCEGGEVADTTAATCEGGDVTEEVMVEETTEEAPAEHAE